MIREEPGIGTRDGLGKRATGGVGADGLIYTSSADDDLLEYLKARNEKVNYESRQLNIQAAASVVSAKLSTDGLSNDVLVTLKIKEGNDVKVYNLAGANGNEGTAAKLRSVRGGNGEKSTGSRALEGTVKCLNLDGGCENTFVRLKIGSTGSSAIINIVFRNSTADLHFDLPGTSSGNPEYLNLKDFVISSIKQENVSARVRVARMRSWEVVNGRSGVTLSILGRNDELLAFAGPLLAPEGGTGVNLPLVRLANDRNDSLDLVSVGNNEIELCKIQLVMLAWWPTTV